MSKEHESMTIAPETFRDKVSTIDNQGKRAYIFPQKPKGKLYSLRTITSIIYLAIFFTLPFIKINGNPMFMLNILERKFVLFSMVFWPQDFFLFVLAMLTFMVFIILFTVVFGRVFCGWACPQTVFMEMIFRKIEYWIDGDMIQQKKLKEGEWDGYKIRKRAIKVSVFFFISFIIANYFLAYLIGMDELMKMVMTPLYKNIGTFFSLVLFTGVFFFVFYWFREQVCLVVCPYGRLQGVLLDKNSIIVAYDYVRGEERGRINRHETRSIGDCIDCAACVKVCPTGIDIRNGTQLECVNCTACIDACDHIMDQVGFERGLIRYASENNIANKEKLHFTPRVAGYSLVLLALVLIFIFLLASRKPVDVTIMRTPGMLYQLQQDGSVSNLYGVKLVNKTHRDIPVTLKLESSHGHIQVVGNEILVPKEGVGEGTFFIYLDKTEIRKHKMNLSVGVFNGNKKITSQSTSFISPIHR